MPQLFLAVLMSAYSTPALHAVLSLERQALEIWTDFSDDLRTIAKEGDPSGDPPLTGG